MFMVAKGSTLVGVQERMKLQAVVSNTTEYSSNCGTQYYYYNYVTKQ